LIDKRMKLSMICNMNCTTNTDLKIGLFEIF